MVRTTKEQRKTLHAKWKLNYCDGMPSYRAFCKTIHATIGMDGAVVVQWAGMWLAIEKDGYAHT